jgi:hypothetical protein
MTETSMAATVFYSDEAEFIAASGGVAGYESFESFTATNDFVSNTIVATDFTITTNPEANLGIHQNPFLELHATDGTKFAGWAARPTDNDVTFTFTEPIKAFGVMTTDALDGGIATAELILSTNGGDSMVVASGSLTTGLEIFVGLIADTPFTEVTLTVTDMPSGGDGIGFDEVRFGTVVPLPAAVWLFGSGVIGLIGLARRKA